MDENTRQRSLNRVETRQMLGPDSQVDDKALAFAPNDPTLTDPFLIMAEDWFSSPGFEWHPHRGLETVTLVVDGVLEHGDNLGNAGALEPGEVQWMTAGKGIVHRELAYRNEHAHTFQLWLNLPRAKKMTDSRYQDLTRDSMRRLRAPGVVIDVHAGAVEGVTGGAETHQPVQGVLARLDPLASYDLAVPAGHRLFAHVVSGRVLVGGRELEAGQTGWSEPLPGEEPTSLNLSAPDGDDPSQVLVYSGTPLHEPVAFGGPFVMNSRAEIQQAFQDFQRGDFGPVPRQARLAYDR
ncbi:pirin family protein [Glycomyces sp. NPDC049804]|uniref:pirin family protein n=1 Tax=Glycomyces sp. NPDC049804 TaxID=3154363 RepID=UPI003419F5C6